MTAERVDSNVAPKDAIGLNIARRPSGYLGENIGREAVSITDRAENKQHQFIRVDRENGRYTDPQGGNWVAANFFRKIGIQPVTLSRYAPNARSVKGINRNGTETILYNEVEVTEQLQEFLSLPRVDKNGRYADVEGANWLVARFFARQFGVSDKTFKKNTEGVHSLRGRDRIGQVTLLYNEAEVIQHFQPFLTLPQVDKKSGAYTDDSNRKWCPAIYFYKSFGIPKITLIRRTKNIQTMEGRVRSGKKVVLYDMKDVIKQLGEFLSLPKVDKETERYVDRNNEGWVAEKFFEHHLGLNHSGLRPRLAGVRHIKGRDRVGKEVILYNEQEAQQKLQYYVGLPQTGGDSKYVDEKGEVWGPIFYFRKIIRDRNSVLLPYLQQIRSIRGRGRNGRETTLYNESDIMRVLKQKEEIASPEQANEQLRRLLED